MCQFQLKGGEIYWLEFIVGCWNYVGYGKFIGVVVQVGDIGEIVVGGELDVFGQVCVGGGDGVCVFSQQWILEGDGIVCVQVQCVGGC